MLDFLTINTRVVKRGIEIYPSFKIKKSKDLMIRGGDFYAIWINDQGLWSTNEDDALQLIDSELDAFANDNKKMFDAPYFIMYMRDGDSGMIDKWHKYCQKQMRDSFVTLDEQLIFSNVDTTKAHYASKKLKYPLISGPTPAYDKLISTLYSENERLKIEWGIGAIVSGDSKEIQKFIVFYGSAGTGKSTILNIIQQLFDGYYTVFDAKALGSSNASFALEPFKNNPLVAIQHDGDLSNINDNTRLNSLVSHELMTVNEKFKSTYANKFKCFLLMGTNKPVKITDAKSGIIRRLIDVTPSGKKLPNKEYERLVKQIPFELGGIASHCLSVYMNNKHMFDDYVPLSMIGATNDFYNYMLESYHIFKRDNSTTLKAAWEMYKIYCDDAKVAYPYSQRIFKEELKNYFYDYRERKTLDDDTRVRNFYEGFREDKFEQDLHPSLTTDKNSEPEYKIVLKTYKKSILDDVLKDSPAQYASEKGTPIEKWANVITKLSDLDTSRLHYVKVPKNHIIIDFDIPGEDGSKNLELNLKEASKWPKTYAELSKSGCGVHLHYIYDGDTSKLNRLYDEHIEIKVSSGNSSLRRKLTKCNNTKIATISSGLPLKGEKKVINFNGVRTEKGIRSTIIKCLNKEVHASTKCNIDWIFKILEDAYNSDLHYDVSDMRNAVIAFAASSTNQSEYCLTLCKKMQFSSKDISASCEYADDRLVFYDVEVFPNLFLVNWKFRGPENKVVRMINPTPNEIASILKYKLIGFNCRRYDNHIMYARLMGYTNEQLFTLSKRIVDKKSASSGGCFFGEAYNLSYTDVYDFAATKQSLKKWEIELGIHHQELGLPWDEPVPEELWCKVAEYCDNDVIATEAVFDHLQGDFVAREILAKLAGGTVNDTTNSLTTKFIFGNDRNPELVYTDLSTGEQTDGNKTIGFPGYEYTYIEKDTKPHNMYRGTDLGYGGYVYSEPGIHTNVALLDVASLHPHSIMAMNCFGKYTSKFKDIVDARILIKHKDFDSARKILNGALAPFLDDPEIAASLAYALKIAINSVYGLTSAGFPNAFRDERNKNNIVALRGSLFMRTLQDEVTKRGFTVAHIKTDSIKIPNATKDIIDFCCKFANKYGYTFEHEATYEKMCLVNDAVYIAKYSNDEVNGKHAGEWTATGTQFQVPYVFKTLFSKEPIRFKDLCETKSVSGSNLYLDMNEGLPDVTIYEKELEKLKKLSIDDNKSRINVLVNDKIPKGHDYRFVGRIGLFCPIKKGCGGGLLLRSGKDKYGDIKYDSANGCKGYRWLEAEDVKNRNKELDIDRSYYDNLVNDAIAAIDSYGDAEWFMSSDDDLPWVEK